MASEVVLVALAAFGCGLVNAVAGGGSLLLFPALLATGMGALPANVTNAVATLPGYAGGAYGFRAELAGRWRTLVPLLGAAIAGSLVGSVALLATSDAVFDAVVPVLVAASAGLVGIQPWVKRRVDAVRAHDPVRRNGGVVAATVYGGYFGGGLGVILIAVLGLTTPDPLRTINAVKSVLSVASGAVTVVVFGLFGPVQWWWVALAAPLTLVGGYAGSHLARRVSETVLRRSVVVVGLVVAVVLTLR